jgi:S-adenosylmethionine hydrolase
LPFARTYADVPAGEACALVGSSGRVEVAVNQGNASAQLRVGVWGKVRLVTALPPMT